MSRQLYINGEWTAAHTRATRPVINPFNQNVLTEVAEGNEEDAKSAIKAARAAFDTGPWPHQPGAERGEKLWAISEQIKRQRTELARLETLDTGKTLTESLADMDGIANVFQYFAGLADKYCGEVIDAPMPNAVSHVLYEPIGVCALITPWNYPLLQAAWKVAPALAAGCTMVLKPSELTPLTTLRLAQIIHKVGLPNGVFNVVTGAGSTVGAALAHAPAVDLVSFTGGGSTGRSIMQAAAGNFKRVALELGGKNPNIVFADADLDAALDHALNAAFFHAGQVCSAGARLLLEDNIHDHFLERLVNRVQHIRLGNGLDAATEMGPLISQAHREKVERYIRLGIDEGATLLTGGTRPSAPSLAAGFFLEPTVFVDCRADMRIVQEEIFGPVLTVESFATEKSAIHLANDTVYGLAGAVWTQDVQRAQRMSKALRLGTVWINDFHPYFPQAPWGGYKQSGIGRELGHRGLEEFMEQKHIFQNLAPQSLHWFGRNDRIR
ncbi:betaine-aldehyde dehydrogenase [Alicyclobacillus fodiniaquatilis]|uniref:Betaine-aldehyde dehydrogenase n=1 Tax=Alicyclobacillus fodiniaquatilis TaxID=1661150 RepID=A0ABW4JNS7_9BACL